MKGSMCNVKRVHTVIAERVKSPIMIRTSCRIVHSGVQFCHCYCRLHAFIRLALKRETELKVVLFEGEFTGWVSWVLRDVWEWRGWPPAQLNEKACLRVSVK